MGFAIWASWLNQTATQPSTIFPLFRFNLDTLIVWSNGFELRFDMKGCESSMNRTDLEGMPARSTVGKPESVEHRAHDYSHELQQAVQGLHGRK